MASKYAGVTFDSSKGKFIGRATIAGKRVGLCNDADETQCAIKRNEELVKRLGAEEAAPFLNEIDPDDVAAPAQAEPEEAPAEQPAQVVKGVVHADGTVTTPEGAPLMIPAHADAYPDDMPFPVTEAEIDRAAAAALGDDDDLRPAPLPDLGDAALRELEAVGIVNLHDSAKRTDDELFKLRSMTQKRVGLLRAAEVEAGLRAAPARKELAPMPPAPTPAPADADVIAPLSDAERLDYDRLKGEAHDNAVKLWHALAEISDRKLYREAYPSFDAFVMAEFDGKRRSWAYQLIDASKTAAALAPIGIQPASERQARELKGAAKVVGQMAPEEQAIVAQAVKALTGTDRPSAAQVNAVVEVASVLYASGTVEDPDTGEAVQLSSLTPERRAVIVSENVTTTTAERLKRQESHIAEKGKQDKTLNGSGTSGSAASGVNAPTWADWLMNYAAQGLAHEHEVRITIRKDPSGNPQAIAQVVVSETGAVIAEGEANTRYVKGTVMSLIDTLKYGGEVK